jgi:hypothetical protein
MNDKPPLDFLTHNLRSLMKCIQDNYGASVLNQYLEAYEYIEYEEE